MQIMHVRKVSSQISLCSPHKLISDDTFRFYEPSFPNTRLM